MSVVYLSVCIIFVPIVCYLKHKQRHDEKAYLKKSRYNWNDTDLLTTHKYDGTMTQILGIDAMGQIVQADWKDVVEGTDDSGTFINPVFEVTELTVGGTPSMTCTPHEGSKSELQQECQTGSSDSSEEQDSQEGEDDIDAIKCATHGDSDAELDTGSSETGSTCSVEECSNMNGKSDEEEAGSGEEMWFNVVYAHIIITVSCYIIIRMKTVTIFLPNFIVVNYNQDRPKIPSKTEQSELGEIISEDAYGKKAEKDSADTGSLDSWSEINDLLYKQRRDIQELEAELKKDYDHK